MKTVITIFALVLSIFLISCQRNDTNAPMSPEMAKNMIKLRGFNADEKDLFQAIRAADLTILKAFFDAGISPNATNEDGETALTFAIDKADPKIVKALIEKADINLQDKTGSAPLHLAFLKEKDDIFNSLMEKGADVNVTGRDKTVTNQSVLYVAVIRGKEDIVKQLIAKGADPNIADNQGSIPLAEACVGATVNPPIIKMLLDAGAKPNIQEKQGSTPLIYIAGNRDISSGKRQEVIKMLLEKGADKSVKENTGKTALDWAKQVGDKNAVELLK